MKILMRLMLSALVGCLVAAVSSCGTNDSDGGAHIERQVMVKITVQDWTGWSEEQPAPTYEERDLRAGVKFSLDVVGSDDALFTVEAVSVRGVELSADQDFSVEDAEGSSSVLETDDEFTLTHDRPLKLSTPTLDGGTTLTFEVI